MGAWLDTTFAGFDYTVFAAFGTVQNEVLTAFAKLFTTLGEATYVALLGVLALALCFFPRTRRLGLGLVLAIAIGTLLTNGLIKPAFDRIRPYNTLGYLEAFQVWYQGAGALSEQDYCFPSGHTTAATEIGVFLCLFLWRGQAQRLVLPVRTDSGIGSIAAEQMQRLAGAGERIDAEARTEKRARFGWLQWLAWIPLLLAFLVGCSRVYLMVHYATDVIAGFIVGTLAGVCGYVISGIVCPRIDARIETWLAHRGSRRTEKYRVDAETKKREIDAPGMLRSEQACNDVAQSVIDRPAPSSYITPPTEVSQVVIPRAKRFPFKLPPRAAVAMVFVVWLAMYGFTLNKVLHEGGTDLIRCDYDGDYRCQTEAVIDEDHPIDGPHYCEIHWEELAETGGE